MLYVSVHVYADGNFYPGGTEGNWDHVGEGAGIGKYVSGLLSADFADCNGRNLNIPWKSQGMGDGDYMFAFQQVIMPIAIEFDPDLVIGAFYFLLFIWQ